MTDTPAAIVVLRLGEVFLKGKNRGWFERRLRQNVRGLLADLPGCAIDRGQGRLYVTPPAGALDAALARLAHAFGISSMSAARPAPADVDALAGAALAEVEALPARPASFKVETRRADKRFPLPSPEVSRLVGARIHMATGIPVDLHHPELLVEVEIATTRSFVAVGRRPGPGGLPVGASGDVALLLSGGIDSPVAGHLMQKRGCRLHAVYFHAPPHTSERARDKVVQLAERLAIPQGGLALITVPFTAAQEAVRDGAPAPLAVVLYRRLMMRIATALARERRCGALATGESLGQVASQTLENIACIEEAAGLPVLRPLIGMDKAEAVALAKRIGTFETSILPYDDCCSLFVPRHPATRARLDAVLRAEAGLDIATLVADAVAAAESERVPPLPLPG